MKRILVLLTVALVMAAMLVASVSPALAKQQTADVSCNNFTTGESLTYSGVKLNKINFRKLRIA